ncbi:PilZ domain-containing protein [Massilia norwichensis]|uniref:PilZ domain-containing protein n=1 Tax=Massilia norwichensis TaxID=1442366 RepID=A0ABT2A5J9_9BURK|nr:PilZ domain-containing protein [Massilia norwichensis]MCS0589472.1 PilZ domain-containing protein [Massilia norwichensis]
MAKFIYLSEQELKVGTPLPWPIYLRSGELLAPQGFVIDSPAVRNRLLDKRPVRAALPGDRSIAATLVDGEDAMARQLRDPLIHLKHNAEGTTLTYKLPGDFEPRNEQVEFIGRIPQQALIVSAPLLRLGSGQVWNDFEGLPIAVQVIFGRNLCVFKTSLMRYASLPSPHMFLRYPTEAVTKPFRQALRVDTRIPVVLAVEDDHTIPAVIMNLSGSGCAIATNFVLGQAGTRMKASFRLKIAQQNHLLTVACTIRSVKGKLSQQMRYGIEFDGSNDAATMLTIKSFVYEHLAER